jgi:hypothetical protein
MALGAMVAARNALGPDEPPDELELPPDELDPLPELESPPSTGERQVSAWLALAGVGQQKSPERPRIG